MISYFVIRLLHLVYVNQSISNEHPADLFDLIRLGKGTSRLKIQDLINSIAREYVMASSNALDKAQLQQQPA
jgi:hypothetical protein